MNWLTIVIIAYFLNAIAITIDKILLSKKIPNPAVYAFFISALSLFALVLIPFGFKFYSLSQIIIALAAGIIFAFALLFMFKAISKNEASRITPFMGGLQPIFIFIFALIFLDEKLGLQPLTAFFIIILGTVAISWPSGKSSAKSYQLAIIATLLFAISYTMNKYVFIQQDFISGFVWTRVGAFLGALFLLIPKTNRQDIGGKIKNPGKNGGGLFIFGQISGALSFILINYAIAISSSVALVNALQGLQYIFLLIIIIPLAKKIPRLLKEEFSPKILTQKILATILIILGLFILFF